MAVDPQLEQLLRGFVDEAQEICERITRALLDLERGAAGQPGKAFADLSRGLHTLKGSASTLGLDDLAEVAHRMEDVLVPLRPEARLSAPVADALLRSLDAWLSHLRATASGAPTPDLGPTTLLLEAAALLEPPSPASTLSVAPGKGDISITGGDEQASGDSWRVGTRQVSALLQDVERLREVRLRLEERQRELDRGLQTLGPSDARAALGAVSRGVTADIEETADIVASLEDGLKAISTQPLRTILDPLRRAVRDLCRQSGKGAAFSVVGGEISIDRRLLDALRSPLVHLVRNAVDHGLEAPALRQQRGKHAEGVLVVRVEQQGNMLFLSVADDGNGVDLGKVSEAALRRGLHTEAELEAMSPSEVQQLIFSPGFSTRQEVSELSGRGVGLDIVRSQIHALSGSVEVQSVAGQGTRFVLSLPADLGSSAVLLVRCGEQQIGVPTQAVEASRAARSSDLSVTSGRMRYAHRDELIPLYDLGALLGLCEPEAPRGDQPLLIVSSQGQRLAIAVDEVLGDRELVIRPLPAEVRSLPAWQGAAVLARGELVLILRVDWLAGAGEQVEAPRQRGRLALVVDDSLTARTMLRASLNAAGFEVHLATCGRHALELLRRGRYDVLIADVQADGLDGFALAAEVRKRPESLAMPVVLLSSAGGAAQVRRAAAAGADSFITKRDWAAGKLLEELAALLGDGAAPRAGR